MRIILAALAAAFFCLPAAADSEARQGSDYVRITALPCTDEAVLAVITAAGEDPADYRAARAELGGVPFSACWKPLFPQRMIHLRYGDGDQGIIPFDELKPVKET